MFLPFSRPFGHFESFGFDGKLVDEPYTKAVKHEILANFLKKNNKVTIFSKKSGYFD